MVRNKTRFPQFLVMALFFWGVAAKAQDTGVSGTDLQLYRPAIESFGYFGVNRPEMLRAGQFHLAVSQDFATDNLFRATINRQDLDIVDRIATTDFFGAVGVNDFMTAALDLPVHLYMKGTNVDTGQEFTSRSLGDIRVGLKFRLLEEKKEGLRPGFAFLFTNTFPTGNERNFLGTSHTVPAADLILGKELKGIGLALNIGGRFPQQKNILGQDFNDQVTYGMGARIPFGFWDRLFSLMGEIRGHFEPGDIETVTSPIEFTLGFLKEFQNGLAVRAGGGGAWNNAIGNPRMRGILTVSYQEPSTHEKKEKERETIEGEAGEKIQELEVQIQELEQRPLEELQPVQEKEPWALWLPGFDLSPLERSLWTTVYFSTGASSPHPESRKWVDEAAQAIRRTGVVAKIVMIQGHTDAVGGEEVNRRLSLDRAKRVKEMLLSRGVSEKLVQLEAYSSKYPVAPNDSKAGRSLNRRAELIVILSE